MQNMRPIIFFIGSFLLLWIGVYLGSRIRELRGQVAGEDKTITVLEGALLTLFGLLLGFTFSMAVSRYDARKQLIIKEANAIGTTWLRSSTLEEPARTRTQQLLRQYVAVRSSFLTSGHDDQKLQKSLAATSDLQDQLWATASNYAIQHRDPVTALYLATLNDSIDSTEERLAAFENRIPDEAWGILIFIGFVAACVVGINATPRSIGLKILLPFVIAGALAMILDMDSPRYGLIVLKQPSMDRLQQQLNNAPR